MKKKLSQDEKKCIRAWEKWNFDKSIKKSMKEKTLFLAIKVRKQSLKGITRKRGKRKNYNPNESYVFLPFVRQF